MIKIQKFSIKYAQKIFDEVDLEIPAGKIVALIGKNGSGKSTLANALAGLTKKYKGEIWLDDLKVSRHTHVRDLRAKIGLVLQNPDHQILFNSVRDELLFVLQNLQVQGDYEKRILATLNEVGMAEFIDSDPQNLSGGQRQRIAIATMLVSEPDYLIFDEATSQLDQEGKKSVYQIMQKLARKGLGVMMITNNLDELIYADEILVIHQRKVLRISRDELLKEPELLEKYGLEVPLTLRLAHKWGAKSMAEIEEKLA